MPGGPEGYPERMSARTSLFFGCLLAGVAVALGAFGAHALKERFTPEVLANWRTGVRYQMWHALALVALGLWLRARGGKSFAGWLFLVGSVFFSGSLYLLCFELWKPVVGPITPLGGTFLLGGWATFAWTAIRSET